MCNPPVPYMKLKELVDKSGEIEYQISEHLYKIHTNYK